MTFEGVDDLSTPCTLTSQSQFNGKCAASLLSLPINNLLQVDSNIKFMRIDTYWS